MKWVPPDIAYSQCLCYIRDTTFHDLDKGFNYLEITFYLVWQKSLGGFNHCAPPNDRYDIGSILSVV